MAILAKPAEQWRIEGQATGAAAEGTKGEGTKDRRGEQE